MLAVWNWGVSDGIVHEISLDSLVTKTLSIFVQNHSLTCSECKIPTLSNQVCPPVGIYNVHSSQMLVNNGVKPSERSVLHPPCTLDDPILMPVGEPSNVLPGSIDAGSEKLENLSGTPFMTRNGDRFSE
jgi:hypothetical protein